MSKKQNKIENPTSKIKIKIENLISKKQSKNKIVNLMSKKNKKTDY
jgi:hypothetical protein